MTDSFIGQLFKYKIVTVFLSLLIGFGIASLFRKQCKHKNCIHLQSPDLQYIRKHTFRHEDKCYQYNPQLIQCPKSSSLHTPDSAYTDTLLSQSSPNLLTNEITLSSFNQEK